MERVGEATYEDGEGRVGQSGSPRGRCSIAEVEGARWTPSGLLGGPQRSLAEEPCHAGSEAPVRKAMVKK